MTILVFRSMFTRSQNPMVPFVLTFDLDHCKLKFWAIFQSLLAKHCWSRNMMVQFTFTNDSDIFKVIIFAKSQWVMFVLLSTNMSMCSSFELFRSSSSVFTKKICDEWLAIQERADWPTSCRGHVWSTVALIQFTLGVYHFPFVMI